MIHQVAALSLTLSLLCQLWKFSESSCTLPAAFSGSWWDSRTNAAITISSLQVTSGWDLTIINQGSFSTYTCIHSNDTHWAFKSDQQVNHLFNNNYYAIVCLEYTKVTDNSYYYYLNFAQDPNINDARIKLVDVDTETGYTSISEYCSPNTVNVPDAREYDVLVKQDMQSSVHLEQYFPDPLLGVFDYSVTDSSGTTCSGTVWDGCYVGGNIDRTTVTVNYTLCGTTIMGSSNGVLYKVAHVFYSDTYYVTLINAAGTATIFTCIAVTQSGSTRSVSTNPGGCAAGQVANSRTSDSISQLIAMTAYETCLFTTTSTTTTQQTTTETNSSDTDTNAGSSTNNSSSGATAAIVGVVLSLFLLIAIIIIAYLLYKKYLQPRKKQITHRTSLKHPMDSKKPLPPDSDFTLSDICMKREPTMADDLVIDSLSPRDRAIPMERVMSRQSAHNPKPEKQHIEKDMVVEPLTPTGNIENPFGELPEGTLKPMPDFQRAPTSFKWMKRIPENEGPHRLTPLGAKPNLTINSAWEAPKQLPAIYRQ